jgi:hypothetical protein
MKQGVVFGGVSRRHNSPEVESLIYVPWVCYPFSLCPRRPQQPQPSLNHPSLRVAYPRSQPELVE